MDKNMCVQCGESREVIKRRKLFCCTMFETESGREVGEEFDRHRFKPYSEKELAKIKSDEEHYIRQMGEMADSFKTS